MCDIVKNPFFSGLNQNLKPLFNGNRGIVTITMWSQNLILTTKMVENRLLGVFGPQIALNLPYFWHNFPRFTKFCTCGADFFAYLVGL